MAVIAYTHVTGTSTLHSPTHHPSLTISLLPLILILHSSFSPSYLTTSPCHHLILILSPHTLSPSSFHPHSHPLSHSPAPSHLHPLTLTLSSTPALPHLLTHTHSLTLSLTFSPSHPHPHPLTPSHSHFLILSASSHPHSYSSPPHSTHPHSSHRAGPSDEGS